MKKLTINTVAGIFDIINAVSFTFSWCLLILASTNDTLNILIAGLLTCVLYAISLAGVGTHIAGLILSKKAGISITGHILGIIGNILFMISVMVLAFPALVLVILAAIFTLMQKPVKTDK